MAIRIKLAELMGKHKYNQLKVATETGIRPATVSLYYHETIKRIEIEHLNKLCKLFNCQVGDLLEYVDENQ
ncbi:helix-turn-helix domain-containing protein [Thermoflavimicrobium daqui]|uniref:XRE family transcriptional regulator n=1 Tax=Thermoflavimicrobium daqui TaxID=2137476 RepID=A0A364K1L8_9BACL|nr:helix-turn-helix transcriptional regulator [Thermoflavimicrobium daqui]RAL21921.1 XRE family transcriptional regulator [Thermoflavimicrobium daqui]